MDDHRRATVAVLVGLVGATIMVAGVGHVYLRRWRRAATWFGGGVVFFAALIVTFADPTATSVASVPPSVLAPYFLFLTFSVADAYLVARRGGAPASALPASLGANAGDVAARGGDANGVATRETDAGDAAVQGTDANAACPACGKPVDADLAFCWYCAAPLGESAERE